MTPEFSHAVDDVYLHVLGLLERIEQNDAVDGGDERAGIRGRLDRAESELGEGPEWQLAKYGLVAWIDDMLSEAPWDGREWWIEQNSLEFELFGTNDRATGFYQKAQEASALPKKDALEVFYVCVVLGFRGLYRDGTGARLAEQLGLPGDLASWARRTAESIRLGQGRPPIQSDPRPSSGAPPLDGKIKLLGASFVFALLAAVASIGVYHIFFSAD